MQFKQLNEELAVACSALKARVDQTASPDAMLTRTLSATTASPAGGDEAVAAVATYIVEESMAEATALVHDLFHEQRQKRIAEGAAAAEAAATRDAKAAAPVPPAATAVEPTPEAKPPVAPDAATRQDGVMADVAAVPKNGMREAEEPSSAATTASGADAAARANSGGTDQVMTEPARIKDEEGAAAVAADVDTDENGMGNLESPQRMALMMDDESLMHMSTKLTAMFIAIQRHAPALGLPVFQVRVCSRRFSGDGAFCEDVVACRCAASGQDARTVQRALIKLVADLKPASHANTNQYQLITKNVGRLSVFLGAR